MITQPQACFNELLNKNNSSCSSCVYKFINQKCKMSQFTSPAHKHLVFIYFFKEILNKRSILTQVSISLRMLQTYKETKKEITLSVIQSQAMRLSSVSSSHWISVAFDQVANHIYVGPVQTPALCRQSCHFRQQFIPPTGDWIESARQSPSGFCQKRHHQKSNFCCRFRVASGHVFTVQFYSLSTNITQCLNEELSNVSTSRKSIWIHIRPKTSISLALVPNLLI